MKLKELIKKADKLFRLHNSEGAIQKKSIKKVLKKLRKHQHRLEEKLLDATQTEMIQKLERKVGITQLHRQKGLKIIKELDEKKAAATKD